MPRSTHRSSLPALQLLALAIGALYTVASILPVPTTWLWFYCFTPLVAVVTFPIIFVVTSPRFGRFAFFAVLATCLVSGVVPALVPILACADPTKAFDLGVLASVPIVLVFLPACLVWHRVHRDRARPSTAGRRLWLVTATSLAIAACLSWNPPEVMQPSEPSLAPLLWEPPHLVWVDEFRLSAVIAFVMLAGAILTIVIVTTFDHAELRRDRLARSSLPMPALGPYRRVEMAEAVGDTSAPLRRALRIDFVCAAIGVASVVYLAARIHHFQTNMEVATRTDVATGTARSVAFPSLRHACGLVSTLDRWDEVDAKLALAHAKHERIGAGDYRWQPEPPRPRRSRGSCRVTFDVDRGYREQYVRSVKFSENETTD